MASCSGFYIVAPMKSERSPFCYINALSMSANNVLHWKVLDPRPAKFTMYVSVTDKFGNLIKKGESSLEEDTLAFQYTQKDVIRVCIESDRKGDDASKDPEGGLRVHLGYRLAITESKDGKLANLKQADHLNQIVFDASNKLENFMVSEDNINHIIDEIHGRSMVVASNLKFVTKTEIAMIVLIFLFQFWHLRRFLLSKKI